MSPCPDRSVLQQLLDDGLAADEQASVQAHLDDCAVCQRTLETLAAESGAWAKAAKHLRKDDDAGARWQRVAGELEGQSTERETIAETDAKLQDELPFLEPSDVADSLGRLGRYDIVEIIGRGGMGVVLKARDEALQRVAAVKVMGLQCAGNATARKRFKREAQAAAAVRNDHVINIHHVDEANGLPYLVMEYIQGISLQERLDKSGPLDLKEILRIGLQIACGLAAAHKQGLVHRDIKPANILLENGVERVKITDFGLARAADDASLTQSGVITGTPMYMSPEQAAGENVDHRSDLFSLGSVLFAMCTGHPPFRASGMHAVLKRVIDDTPRPIREINADIPQWLCDIIAKLLAKKPAERFQSAQEVADLLEQHLSHLQQPSEVPEPLPIENVPPGSTLQLPKDARWPLPPAVCTTIEAFLAIFAWPMCLIVVGIFFGGEYLTFALSFGMLAAIFILLLLFAKFFRRAEPAESDSPPVPRRKARRRWIGALVFFAIFAILVPWFGPSLMLFVQGNGSLTYLPWGAGRALEKIVVKKDGVVVAEIAPLEQQTLRLPTGTYELIAICRPDREVDKIQFGRRHLFLYESLSAAMPGNRYTWHLKRGEMLTVRVYMKSPVATNDDKAKRQPKNGEGVLAVEIADPAIKGVHPCNRWPIDSLCVFA